MRTLVCAVLCCSVMVAARPVATPVPPLGASDVAGLLKQLDDPKPEVRGQAARDLLRVEPFSAARSALAKVAALARSDPHEDVRCAAIATLGRYGPEPVVLELFQAALEANTPSVARAAASSLPAGGELPLIRVALTARDSSVRSTSLSRLRSLPSNAETAALLEQALSDPNEHVRTAAAQVIAETAKGVASLGPALMKAASAEKDELTRSFELRALVATGGAPADAAPTLTAMLTNARDASSRAQAALVLGQLAGTKLPAQTIAALITVMQKDADQLARGYAAQTLGKLGPAAQSALGPLLAMIADRQQANYRSLAVEALVAVDAQRRPDVTAALRSAASDTEEETQAAALRALAGRGKPDAVTTKLLRGLALTEGTPNAKVWAETLKTLGLGAPKYGAPRELAKLLDDDDELTRGKALREALTTSQVDPRWQPGLVRCLRANDPLGRLYAAQLLGRLGPAAQDALPELARRLLEPTPRVRYDRQYAEAMVAIGGASEAVLATLGEHLGRGQTFAADASANALALLGAPAVPTLTRAVRSPRPYTAFAAARALGALGPTAASAVPALLELAADPSRLTVQLTDRGGSSDEVVRAALKAIAPDDPKVKAALAR